MVERKGSYYYSTALDHRRNYEMDWEYTDLIKGLDHGNYRDFSSLTLFHIPCLDEGPCFHRCRTSYLW